MMTREQPWHLRNTDYAHEREYEDLKEISRLHQAMAHAAELKTSVPDLTQKNFSDLLIEGTPDDLLLTLRHELNAEELSLLSRISAQAKLEAVWAASQAAGAQCASRRWPAQVARPAPVPSEDLRRVMACFRDSPFSKSILIKRATAQALQMSFLETHSQLRSELRSRLRFEWAQGFLKALQPALRVSPVDPQHFDELKWEI